MAGENVTAIFSNVEVSNFSDGLEATDDNFILGQSDLNNTVSVFPNPTSGQLNINAAQIQETAINLVINNTFGQTVYQQNWNTEETTTLSIDLDHLPNGTYFIRLHSLNETEMIPFVINK